MYRVTAYLLVSVLVFSLSACGPTETPETVNLRSGPAGVDNGANAVVASQGFGAADVEKVEILLGPNALVPWQTRTALAAGQFPDKSKSQIRQNLVWSSSDTKVIDIAKSAGLLVALKAGKATIAVSFMQFKESVEVIVKAPETPQEKLISSLPEPASFSAKATSSTEIELTWAPGGIQVTGHQLAYAELPSGESPPTDCKTGKTVTLSGSGDKLITKAIITELKPNTNYGFRLCSLQEIKVENLDYSRSSEGMAIRASTKAASE